MKKTIAGALVAVVALTGQGRAEEKLPQWETVLPLLKCQSFAKHVSAKEYDRLIAATVTAMEAAGWDRMDMNYNFGLVDGQVIERLSHVEDSVLTARQVYMTMNCSHLGR